MTIAQGLFIALMVWTLGQAWILRAREQGAAALAILVAAVLSPLVQSSDFAHTEVGILVVDAGLFAALGLIAIRSSAFWPMWAAGFQLGTLAIHLAAAKYPEMVPAAYAEALVIWSFPVLLTVAIGFLREPRQTGRMGRA